MSGSPVRETDNAFRKQAKHLTDARKQQVFSRKWRKVIFRGGLISSLSEGRRPPEEISIREVLDLYLNDIVPSHARPTESASRIATLTEFWGLLRLSDVTGARCRAYVSARTSVGSAARELCELRAAINHHRREGYCSEPVSVILPDRLPPRERWLTHSEAARLIWKAWTYRSRTNFHAENARVRRHIAKFILVGCYTGTRAGSICGASFERLPSHGYIDVDRGVFYRRAPGAKQTKKRAPPVRLPRPLLAHLRRWKRNGQRFVVEWRGKPVRNIHRAFNSAVADAQLGNDVVPHSLRHTAATWLMQGGADIWEASEYLGMTPTILIRAYGHHHPERFKTVHEALRRSRLPT